MKKLMWLAIGAIVAWLTVIPVEGQGSLSSQVLRLLTRDNTWTGLNDFQVNTFGTGGIHLTDGTPSDTTNRLYSSGGTLFFNGGALPASPGAGTVTSVDLAAPGIFSVSGNPITGAGTITLGLATQAANQVWAGPTGGGAVAPAFRLLVAADIPDISATYATAANAMAFTNKTGNISQWTNDSGYITTLGVGSVGITTLGTITTGTWNATVITGQYGGTGVANTGKTITLGGNLTTSGAFATTLTVSGATNVTLPTSGTLVNTTVTTLSSLVSVGTITTGTWSATTIAVNKGGTGLTSYAVGDLLYASGATTIASLADVATGKVLCSGGVGVAPSYCTFNIANSTGTLGVAQGGLGITSVPSNGQIPIGNGSTYIAAIPSGTANQITVTTGAGTLTFSTPQNIHTAATPQFARMGLGVGPDSVAVLYPFGVTKHKLQNDGNSGTALTFDLSLADYRKATLTGNATFTFNNPVTDATYKFFLTQDGTGSRTVTWPAAVKWYGGSAPTLTTTAGKTDTITCEYNGTNYRCDKQLNVD